MQSSTEKLKETKNSGSVIMSKRIVLCFDGTDNQFGESNTNIAKLCRLLEQGEPDKQIIFYDPGVGSKNFAEEHADFFSRSVHKIKEHYLGYGLQANIEDGLRFLMEHYVPDDKVFLFGFSRGAFTARSLAGMLKRTGLLRKGQANLIKTQTKIYNEYDYESSDQSKGNKRAQEFKATFGQECPVHFIGVWDTVSALYGLAGKRFHASELPDAIPYGYHALALNEDRTLFAPEPWVLPDEGTGNKKQVWFAGCHSDVGGGYDKSGLGDITLQWMLDYACAPGGRDNAIGVLVKNNKDDKKDDAGILVKDDKKDDAGILVKDDKKDDAGILVKDDKKDYKFTYNIKPDPSAKLHSEGNKWFKGAILGETILVGAILAATILVGAILVATILEAAILEAAILATILVATVLVVAILEATRSGEVRSRLAILVAILATILATEVLVEVLAAILGTEILAAILATEILAGAILGVAIVATTRSEDARSRAAIVGAILAAIVGAAILVVAILEIARSGAAILGIAILAAILAAILEATRSRAKISEVAKSGGTILGAILAIILAAILAAIVGAILATAISGGTILEVAGSGTTILEVVILETAILGKAILEVIESRVAILGLAILAAAIVLLFIGLRGKRKIVASNPEAKPLLHESVRTRMNKDEDYKKQMYALLKANDLQLSDIEFVKK